MRITLATLFAITTLATFAQSVEVDMFKSYFNMEKREAVAEFMDLDESMEIAFWSIYDDYEAKRARLVIDRLTRINEFGRHLHTLDDQRASDWLDMTIAGQNSEEQLLKKYVKMMAKQTSPTIALKFAQVDNYFSTMVDYHLYKQLPNILNGLPTNSNN